MIQQLDRIRRTRAFLLDAIRPLSTEQWNLVPPGFNNNIIWNLAHMIATQQTICYVRAEVPPKVEDAFIASYKSGTRPTQFVGPEEIEMVKELLFTTLDELESDITQNLFTGYKPWTSRYTVDISNIHEAITFLLYHEGLHAGIITGMKNIITHKTR